MAEGGRAAGDGRRGEGEPEGRWQGSGERQRSLVRGLAWVAGAAVCGDSRTCAALCRWTALRSFRSEKGEVPGGGLSVALVHRCHGGANRPCAARGPPRVSLGSLLPVRKGYRLRRRERQKLTKVNRHPPAQAVAGGLKGFGTCRPPLLSSSGQGGVVACNQMESCLRDSPSIM